MLNIHAAAIKTTICNCVVVATYSLNTVQLSPNTGYVKGDITLVDGSRLVFFEFSRQKATGLEREKYRYHFMNASNQLVFRYDNAPHHPEIVTFPHHKHLPNVVTGSLVPCFADVLIEVESHVLELL